MNAPVSFARQPDPWSRRRAKKAARLARVAPWMKGQVLETSAIVEALQALLEPGDNVALEGGQPEAGRLPVAFARPGRSGKAPRPAPPDLERQPAGTSDAVRARHRP